MHLVVQLAAAAHARADQGAAAAAAQGWPLAALGRPAALRPGAPRPVALARWSHRQRAAPRGGDQARSGGARAP